MFPSSSGGAQVRRFVWLSFAASWGIGGLALLIDRSFPEARALSPASPLYYLAAYAISLVGILLTAWYAGVTGIRKLATRLVPRAADAWAYAAVVVGYLAIAAIAAATSGGVQIAARLPWTATLLGLPLIAVRDPGPIGEEFGWRGFALPRLLECYSPLNASLRLGIIHTLWHVPLFLIPGMPQAQVFFPAFAVGVVAISVINTFFHVRTTSNLLLAIVVHLLANAAGGIAMEAGALNAFFLLEGLVAIVIVATGGLSKSAVAE